MSLNGFPYFQFHVDKWLTGKISAFDLDEQGLFLHFCMLAWAGHGPFNVCSTTVQRRFRKSADWLANAVAGFADVGIVAKDGDKYRIKFIDEQLAELTGMRVKRSEAGKKSAEARALLKTTGKKRKVEKTIQNNTRVLNKCSTPAEQVLIDFEEAWKAYPDKSGKVRAQEAYLKHRKTGDTQADILAGIERYKAYVAAKRAGGQDLNYRGGERFFYNASWRDEWTVAQMTPIGTQSNPNPPRMA